MTATQTNAELADGIEEIQKTAKGENRTILGRVRDRLREKSEQRGVELPTGETISATCAKFLRERPGSQYLGSEFCQTVRVRGGRGLEREERWDPIHQHGDELVPGSKRMNLVEYCYIPDQVKTESPSGDLRGQTPVGKKSPAEVWQIKNGNTAIHIGRTVSVSAMRRCRDRGVLSAAGERLLRGLTQEGNENEHGAEAQQ